MRDSELDRLKAREQAAFEAKQTAWQNWHDSKERADIAYNAMQDAWQERCRARDEMNREYDDMQQSSANYRAIWDEYGRIRDANNAQIESLKSSADYEHQQMVSCFEQASYAYDTGDKAAASTYAQEGHEHKALRDDLNEQIRILGSEVKDARMSAEARAPKTDSSAFRAAQREFKDAKEKHLRLQGDFKQLKEERNRLREDFKQKEREHQQAKAEFQQRLSYLKTVEQAEKDQARNKVNVALIQSNAHYVGTIFGKDAKIVERKREPGTYDVYFAGLGAEGDGIGHGHAVIDPNGNVTYLRDAWMDHDDYLIDDARRRGDNTHRI